MVFIRGIAVWVAIICLVGVADAKLYKWVDENGVTHFSNTAPPQEEVEVHTKAEANSAGTENGLSPGLDSVIDSYRQDELRDKADEVEKRYERTRRSSRNDQSKINLYETRVKRDEVNLEQLREELKQVERASYSDSEMHKAKVQRYRTRVRKAELELEEDRIKLERARGGQ
jgi:hypothetical protein